MGTLRGAAFPAVTHLHVRNGLLATRRRWGFLYYLSYVGMSPASLEDAVALFPKLEVVGGVEFASAAHMRRVLVQYPRLRSFMTLGSAPLAQTSSAIQRRLLIVSYCGTGVMTGSQFRHFIVLFLSYARTTAR
ncbi:hypothetical protein BV25DRAFT_302731 [Artomyces pyxidatus]|uniref:Uncharacterized protein n=1 Tax=Artomyces pyxidatus TaxID=48021 RepID=A0ACB8T8L9_9AGAM|nr:hypothetical protein BV25DRAFT_302731 [Artomyces pyxidatus]